MFATLNDKTNTAIWPVFNQFVTYMYCLQAPFFRMASYLFVRWQWKMRVSVLMRHRVQARNCWRYWWFYEFKCSAQELPTASSKFSFNTPVIFAQGLLLYFTSSGYYWYKYYIFLWRRGFCYPFFRRRHFMRRNLIV